MKFIAELCQNHNGDFNTLCHMVDAAAEGGASHIKIQHIYSRNLVFRAQFEQGLKQDDIVKAIHRPWEPEFDRLKGLELSDKDCMRFVELVTSLGLTPMTTCFTRGDISRIKEQGFKTIKVASYDCASFPMLKELSNNFDYLYVSTGASFDDEIKHASNILTKYAKAFSFLHCVTQYPTPLDEMHLNRINWLKQFTNNVGFSDHSLVSRDGLIAAKAAIVCGANIIERHFTIKDPQETKDGPVSIDKEGIRALINFASLTHEDQCRQLDTENSGWRQMLGFSQRWLSDKELLNRDYFRGRFASPRREGSYLASEMIFNWEETPL